MKATVTGAAGRTGRHIIRAVVEEPSTRLVAALEREDHELLGKDVGRVAGVHDLGIPITSDLEAALADADVVVDFSVPTAAARVAEAAAASGSSLVVGTTGLDSLAMEALRRTASVVPIVAAPNMSVGVNVVLDLLTQAATLLGSEYDFEVFEMHHRGKVDAPSGTALRMAEVVAGVRGLEPRLAARHGRSGALGPREDDEIGIHAARGGDVVGDHIAIFAGQGERVEVVHRAHGRGTFARGAVRAALWTAGRAPGLYQMKDVLIEEVE